MRFLPICTTTRAYVTYDTQTQILYLSVFSSVSKICLINSPKLTISSLRVYHCFHAKSAKRNRKREKEVKRGVRYRAHLSRQNCQCVILPRTPTCFFSYLIRARLSRRFYDECREKCAGSHSQKRCRKLSSENFVPLLLITSQLRTI